MSQKSINETQNLKSELERNGLLSTKNSLSDNFNNILPNCLIEFAKSPNESIFIKNEKETFIEQLKNRFCCGFEKFWDILAKKMNNSEKILKDELNEYLNSLASIINLLANENFCQKNFSKFLAKNINKIILNVIKNHLEDEFNFLYKMIENFGITNSQNIFSILRDNLYFWENSFILSKLSDDSKLAYLILLNEEQNIYLLNKLSGEQIFELFDKNSNFETIFFQKYTNREIINVGDFRKNFFYSISKIDNLKVLNFYRKLIEKFSFCDYFPCLAALEQKKIVLKIFFETAANFEMVLRDNSIEAHRTWTSFFDYWPKLSNNSKSIVFEILHSDKFKNTIQNSKNNFFLIFFVKYFDKHERINELREIIFPLLNSNQKKVFFDCSRDTKKSFISISPIIFKSFIIEDYLSLNEKISLFNLFFYKYKDKLSSFIVENMEKFPEGIREQFYNLLMDENRDFKVKMVKLLDESDKINELIEFFNKKYPSDATRRIRSLNLKNEKILISTLLMNKNFANLQIDSLNSVEKFFLFRKDETKNNFELLSREMQAFVFITLLNRSLANSTEIIKIDNDTVIQTENKQEIKFSELNDITQVLVALAIQDTEFFLYLLEPDISLHPELKIKIRPDTLSVNKNVIPYSKFSELPVISQALIFLYYVKIYEEQSNEEISNSTKIPLSFLNFNISFPELEIYIQELVLEYIKNKISFLKLTNCNPNIEDYLANPEKMSEFEDPNYQDSTLSPRRRAITTCKRTKIRQTFSYLPERNSRKINKNSSLPSLTIPKLSIPTIICAEKA